VKKRVTTNEKNKIITLQNPKKTGAESKKEGGTATAGTWDSKITTTIRKDKKMCVKAAIAQVPKGEKNHRGRRAQRSKKLI